MTFRFENCVLSLLIFGGTPAALARFVETDASRIDPEERYNTETYNDKYSYQHPVSWYRIYDQADAAVRIHAGSLNASRFDYIEEVKFYAANSVAGFSFFQERKEDVLEQSTLREVRSSLFLPAAAYVSVVADGGTFKEYGDVGFATGWGDIKRPYLEILYWSVDQFYETKKSEAGDKRERSSRTIAVTSHIPISTQLLLTIRAEDDSPLKWSRPSQGYTYEYRKSSFNTGGRLQYSTAQSISLELAVEKKEEAKTWTAVDYKKAMNREVRISELKWLDGGPVEHKLEIAYIDRRVLYQQTGAAIGGSAALPEELSPATSKRDELAMLATRYEPLFGERHYMQYGLHANFVNLDESRHDRICESKGQWAWEYRYTDKTRVLLNTSWDINQLTDDFPYEERPFRPWGGGDIQFIAAF